MWRIFKGLCIKDYGCVSLTPQHNKMQYLRQRMADVCKAKGGAIKQIFSSQNQTGLILLRHYRR